MADLDELLNDISTDVPCGEYLEYDPAYLALAKDIQGKPEDPITGEAAQPPNWRDVKKAASALLQRSKDLQVTVYLIRALIALEGVSGLRDGLKLLLGFLEKHWDGVHPVLDPDDNLDPTARVNILEELSNFDSVLRPLFFAPLADAKSVGSFSLRDIQAANDKISLPEGEGKPDIGIIKGAFRDMPEEALVSVYQTILDCAELVRQIDQLINLKVGVGNGPDLSGLSAQLKDMKSAVEQYSNIGALAEAALDEAGEAVDGDAGPNQSPARQKAALAGDIQSRQDVLKALDLICKYYAEHEPSSPVPILLNRAKRLVSMDFMDILQNLLPDAVSQMEYIKGPEPDSEHS